MKAVYRSHGPESTETGDWCPPKEKKSLQGYDSRWYLWAEGRMAEISDPGSSHREKHSSASLFVRDQHETLLAANLDATQDEFSRVQHACWREIKFYLNRTTNGDYSFVDYAGQSTETPATMPAHMVPQLLPQIYNGSSSRTNRGLVGRLPILIGLAALSAEPAHVNEVLTNSIRLGSWRHHGHRNGRRELHYSNQASHHSNCPGAKRGVVVNVFLAKDNARGSTHSILDDIVKGISGPFYGPQ